MKTLLTGLTLVVVGLGGFAAPARADLAVNISSFVYLERAIPRQLYLAELCGKVTGAPAGAETAVHLHVDPKSSNPASYNQVAAPTGNFCAVVVIYTGLAEAEARVLGGTAASPVITARVEATPAR